MGNETLARSFTSPLASVVYAAVAWYVAESVTGSVGAVLVAALVGTGTVFVHGLLPVPRDEEPTRF